jgi:hypothetical protein
LGQKDTLGKKVYLFVIRVFSYVISCKKGFLTPPVFLRDTLEGCELMDVNDNVEDAINVVFVAGITVFIVSFFLWMILSL